VNNLKVFGKFLDQPLLVAKFQKVVPKALIVGGAMSAMNDARKEKPENRKKAVLKNGITMGVTIASALAAPHIASKLTKRPLPKNITQLKTQNTELVDSFVKVSNIDKTTKNLLDKAKDKILNPKEVKKIFEGVEKKENGQGLLEKLIPSPQNISAKDIFSEIGYLSIFGGIPVLGGILGGVVADKVTDKASWKEKVPNKIKEGLYQYLANIFMCNVGAGVALGILEKLNIKSKGARAAGMTAGIVASGIIGGSKIANTVDEKIISKIFKQKEKYKERKPEILDIGLHTDDIATVSLLSGLKWIEPALPAMYTVSGYRAGMGYRN
jgi:hypothetical protein